ncbi:MAG TPA: hypothetical protein VK846_12830 [Candidatus Limnocylindria bacterium]|nr:hypothetical protein [Candidatus Limnocylindria bacterium]
MSLNSAALETSAWSVSSAEALYRYVNVLGGQKRFQDARRLTGVTQLWVPSGATNHQLLEELNKLEANANKGN